MTLRRLLLGRSLQTWRERAEVSRADVAAELGCTPDRVRHLESGRNLPSRPDLIVMCGLYNIPANERQILLDTRYDAQKPGWWQTYKLPKSLADYVTLENDAISVRNWEVELIPGLLQTEDYARKVESIVSSNATAKEVDKWVAARLNRQKRLISDESELNNFEAVISEAALLRCAADSDVGAGQLERLLDLGIRENVVIRILPMSIGLHHAMAGSFAVLDFPRDTWPATGYQEYAIGGHMVDDPEAVEALGKVFSDLQERALSEADSARLISQYVSSESE